MKSAKADINNCGTPGTLQHLIYCAARAGMFSWEYINSQAQAVLCSIPVKQRDTEYGLLVNALCCATEHLEQVEQTMKEQERLDNT